ncbi:MAG: threonylcarbamoyl-AMP synthase [Deltaproteobacteria bacterium CG11_big_fil_rev_8_21_14_0_20_47_16]|nr:MAG: threonylcarbamoyl-AMP synthase [Deltaproteobacteria bacterium CG11_big_fil_rev_8_21_14_0_20_47_16]
MSKILHVDARDPEPHVIAEAVEALKAGQAVAYPTETLYGLAVDVTSDKAVKHLYDLKRRDYGLPVAILVADMKMLQDYVTNIPEPARGMVKQFWPGALTILFTAGDKISRSLMTNTGKIGIRISSHPVATALVRAFGKPITTTSANLSGYPPSLQVKHVKKYFSDRIDCILDGGECRPSLGSTVVDVSEDTMAIIREGAIQADCVIRAFQGKPA